MSYDSKKLNELQQKVATATAKANYKIRQIPLFKDSVYPWNNHDFDFSQYIYNKYDPDKLGFSDKGTFEIFTLIKNENEENFNEGLVREFATEVYELIVKKKYNYIGWQDIPKEPKRLQTDIEIFAASNHYLELEIDENEELMERILKAILHNYSLK